MNEETGDEWRRRLEVVRTIVGKKDEEIKEKKKKRKRERERKTKKTNEPHESK